MVDLKLLEEKYGISQENLKTWLFADLGMLPMTDAGDLPAMKRGAMRNRIRSRITENLNRNLTEGKHWHALDTAWDTPFRQVTPTLLQSLMDKDPSSEEVNRIVNSWGISHMLNDVLDPKTGQSTGKKKLDIPIFFNVFVPLVKAYVTIRWAKIVNDRRLTPFLDYSPAKSTAISRLKCAAITDRVQVMSIQYDYFNTMKQAVLKMLHYGSVMQFPKEEWHTEEQRVIATQLDVALGYKNAAGESAKVGDEILKKVKEGLRYHHPHPSRTIRDLNHPSYTYNTDTGCEYGGYWRIIRFKDLVDGSYWNTDKISIGATDLIGDNQVFFSTVYPCSMAWPTNKAGEVTGSGVAVQAPTAGGNTLAVEAGFGVGDLDREKKMANQFYTSDHNDQAVLVTEYFEKLIPADNGLGTYDCPVWFRFVVAGDQATILYAAPLPSCPITYAGYDEDASRSLNSSMTLEIMPFQDQFGNLLTQMLLGVKNNLANLVMIDTNQVEQTNVDKITNFGERFFRSLNILGFDSKKAMRNQTRVQEAVQSFKFPQMNTSEIINSMKVILDTLERVLVMSSQEAGQAASHEQTREEVKNIKESGSSRLVFTSIPVDAHREAMKAQIYCYLMAYGETDFYAHIPSDVPLDSKLLQALGFQATTDPDMHGPSDMHRPVHTKLHHLTMEIWEFASAKDGDDRVDEGKLASTLSSMLSELLANPITAQAIGADQALQFATQISHWAGLPNDFAFKNAAPGATPQQQQQAAQQQLMQVVQAVMKLVTPELQKGLQPVLEQVKALTANDRANTTEIGAIMRVLQIAPEHPKGPDVHQAHPHQP